ncbi:MAG: hypothetical protein JXQ23_01545 [Clostridia bacterium]|nr:hypothetical protein [Clostridia bacterium]
MNKGVIAILLTLIIILPFTGFKLANPNAEIENRYNDNIVGVYITQEHLDLFDFDSYISDNFTRNGDMVISESDSKKYNGRLYATYDEETRKFSFDEIEGILFASIRVEEEYGTCMVGSSSEGISDAHNSVSITDDSEDVILKGTIYSLAGQDVNYFINPVYQDNDGNVYVTGGSGISSQSNQDSEGETISQTITSEMIVEINKERKKHKTEITIAINLMFAPEKINILEFDQSGECISKKVYLPGEVPKEMVPSTSTEYLVVETYKSGNHITREMIEKNDTSFTTFSVKETGICVQNYTAVTWNK